MVLGASKMGEKKEVPALRQAPERRKEPLPCWGAVHHPYLRVGDIVFHKKFRSWGRGRVLEAWASDVPGGLCYVRILFQDGKSRVFDNSYDSACCCYYAGVTLIDRIEI